MIIKYAKIRIVSESWRFFFNAVNYHMLLLFQNHCFIKNYIGKFLIKHFYCFINKIN